MAKKENTLKNAEEESDFDSIPIVFITDNGYVVPTSVAITSLICNKKPTTKYSVFILTNELTEENKKRFKLFNSKDIKLEIITVSIAELEGLHKYEVGTICQATPAALLKFKLPEIFNSYKKIIYLDGDILVRNDLSDLYSEDVSNYYVAAVHDTGKLYHDKEVYKKIPLYFNSGVMLLNLEKCRKDNVTEKLIEEKKRSTDNSLMDQNILNIVFKDHIKIIDIKYNFLILNLTRASAKFEFKELNKLFNANYNSLSDIEKQTCVLHFSSKDKPWKFYDGPYSKEWYDYFIKSPHKDSFLIRSKFVLSEFNSTQRKALIIELNPCHGECIPGYVKYFLDLGYDLRIIMNSAIEVDDPLADIFSNKKVEVSYMPQSTIVKFIQDTHQMNQYSVCLFNSSFIYKFEKQAVYLLSPEQYQVKILTVDHRQELIDGRVQSRSNSIVLKQFGENKNIFEVNPHYFGNHRKHKKNQLSEFVVVGGIDEKRKNHSLLISAVNEMINKGENNFHITIVGKGSINNLPTSIKEHLTLTGRLSFPKMYEVMKKADFFLPLLDYENPDHLRYCTTGTSGSFQLIYGFNIPCIIDANFAKIYNLTDKNSISYNKGEFAEALIKAVKMKNDEYQQLQDNLAVVVEKIYRNSLEHMRNAIETEYKKESFPIKAYLLFPYYLISNILFKQKKNEIILSNITDMLHTSRIDIKNFGQSNNAVEVTADNGIISTPKYLTSDQGIGQEVNCKADKETIKIKIKNNGKLVIRFRGIAKQYNGKRFPVWTDYKSIKINGKELLAYPVATWHDEPYTYETPVKNGQKIKIKVVFCDHNYDREELKTTLQKIVQYKGYLNDNIENILNIAERKYIAIQKNVVQALPQVTSDAFISVGYNCQIAQHLKSFNLRYASLPFDWLTNYSLHLVIKTIKNGLQDWFINYKENKSSNSYREVVDLNTQVKCPHFFPKDKSVEEYLPIFKEKFSERNNRFIKILRQSAHVCFVSQRQDNVSSLMYFLQEISAMFPNLSITMINLHNTTNDNRTLYCATIDDKIKLYNIYAENSPDTDKTWMGNTKLWAKIIGNWKLSKEIKPIAGAKDISKSSNLFVPHKEFFVIDTNNLDSVQTKLYGYIIQNNGIIEEGNIEHLDNKDISGCGAYIYINRGKDSVTIHQDFNGSYGLFLFRKGNYFALSNSFFYLLNYLKNQSALELNLELNKDYINYMLIQDVCSESYTDTPIKNIKLLDKDAVVRIGIAEPKITIENIDYKVNQYSLDSKAGIKILDQWFEKWMQLFKNLTEKTHNIKISLSGGMDSRLILCLALQSGIDLNQIRIHSIKDTLYTHIEDYEIASEMAKYFHFNLNEGHLQNDSINFTLEDIINIYTYNKLPFHKELKCKYDKLKYKRYNFSGAGGENIRSHWDYTPQERTAKYISRVQRYRDSETIKMLSESIRKIANENYEYIKSKYHVVNDDSKDILRFLYLETRCGHHFGRESVDDYFANNYMLSPLLDPLLLQIKLRTEECSDDNLLFTMVFIRYCPKLLDFKFEGNRSITQSTIDYARKINKLYPYKSTKLKSSKDFNVIVEDKDISKQLVSNIRLTAKDIFDFLKNALESINLQNIICKQLNKDVIKFALKNAVTQDYIPLREVYPLISTAITLNTLENKDLDNINHYNWLNKQVSEVDHTTIGQKELEEKITAISSDLTSYRLNIKNVGIKSNSVEIFVSDAKIEEPQWFSSENGKGKIVQGNQMTNTIKVKAVNDGVLQLYFMGQYRTYKGQHIPVWIDYKSIKIDGKEILFHPVATWHNQPFKYEMNIKNGQEISIEFEQQYHQYSNDELKDILLKLYQNNIILDDQFLHLLLKKIKKGGKY